MTYEERQKIIEKKLSKIMSEAQKFHREGDGNLERLCAYAYESGYLKSTIYFLLNENLQYYEKLQTKDR